MSTFMPIFLPMPSYDTLAYVTHTSLTIRMQGELQTGVQAVHVDTARYQVLELIDYL
jgi:hypothetical protein